MPTPGLGARLPQRRPRPLRRRGAGLPRPRRRPGQGRRPADRARRDRQRAARAAGGERRGGRGAPQRGRATACSSATSRPSPASTPRPPSSALRSSMPAALVPAAGRGRHPPDPDLGQDRPRRAALAAAGATRRRGVRRGTAASRARRRGSRATGPPSSAAPPSGPDDDFFDLGGGSLTAAQLVCRLRERFPEVTVADVYDHPGLARPRRGARRHGDPHRPAERRRSARCRSRPRPRQVLASRPAAARSAPCAGSPGSALGSTWSAAACFGLDWLPDVALGLGAARLAAAGQPARAGCMLGAAAARAVLRRRRAPAPTRAAARCTCGSGSPSASPTSSAPPTCRRRRWCKVYARLLGAGSAGTSTCTASRRSPACSPSATAARSSPRSTSPGHWLDGDVLHVGAVRVGADARVGARSTLLPGCRRRRRRRGRRRAPRSSARCPTARPGRARRPVLADGARGPWATSARANRPAWLAGVRRDRPSSLSLLPILAVLAGARRGGSRAAATRTASPDAVRTALLWLPARDRGRPSSCSRCWCWLAVRLLALGLEAGHHPVHGRRPGRRGRCCGCSTRRAPGCSRCTPAR